jgi:hypothetical protein
MKDFFRVGIDYDDEVLMMESIIKAGVLGKRRNDKGTPTMG